jgi:hypothetical protein
MSALTVNVPQLADLAPALADLLTPTEVRKRLPGASRLHPKTVLRWMTIGVAGPVPGTRVVLRSLRAGRQRLTTAFWLVEFFERQTAPTDGQQIEAAAPSSSKRASPSSPRRSARADSLRAKGFGKKRRRK